MTETSAGIGAIAFKTIRGEETSLADFAGQVVLIVNVASKCGLTPQYTGLEALYAGHKEQGLVILGFPANDFAGQEPGTDDEIAEFCTSMYSVSFPLMSKITVIGPEKHPLYAELTAAVPTAPGKEGHREKLRGYGMTPTEDPEVLWNFEKFLVARDGSVVGRFAPATTPEDPTLVEAVEAELAR